MGKMKRFAITMLMGLTACIAAAGFSACDTVKKGERENGANPNTHTYGEWLVDKEATCEKDGSKHRECTDEGCDEKQTEVIPAIGHKMVDGTAVSATCTTSGKTAGKRCANCGYETGRENIPATGHDTEFKNPNSKPATCMSAAYCGDCGKTYGEKLDHEPDIIRVSAQAATCLTEGWAEYHKCTICGYNDKEVIPALGHDVSCTRSEDSKKATCTTKAYCGVCKMEYGKEPSHDLSFEHAKSTPATCKDQAYCGVCGEFYGEALGHELVWIEAKAATCTEGGWESYRQCTRCDLNTKVTTDKLGHDEEFIEAVEPTCTTVGYTSGTKCSRCQALLEQPKVIAPLGHDGQREGQQDGTNPLLSEYSYFGNCAKKSYCGICHSEYGDLSATGHDLISEEAKAPTCISVGWDAYAHCTRCDYTTYQEIAMLPHTPIHVDAKMPTCTEDGYKGGDICSYCGKLEILPALGHDGYRNGQTQPALSTTVIGDCVTQSYCGICGAYGEEPTGHIPRKEATCTEKAECKVCGQEYGEATGHYYKDGYDFCLLCGAPKECDLYFNKEND